MWCINQNGLWMVVNVLLWMKCTFWTVNRLIQGVPGNRTVFLGHAKCGTVTLADFPQCLSHPCHFHSPKTKVFVWRATVRRLEVWFVRGTPHSLNSTGWGNIPVTDTYSETDCPTVITDDVRLVGLTWKSQGSLHIITKVYILTCRICFKKTVWVFSHGRQVKLQSIMDL